MVVNPLPPIESGPPWYSNNKLLEVETPKLLKLLKLRKGSCCILDLNKKTNLFKSWFLFLTV